MKKSNLIGAVDIGTTKIVTIIGRKNENNKLEVLSLSKTDSTGVKKGVVQNIVDTVNAIAKTVEDAQAKAGVKLNEVYVGIAGQHIRSIRNRSYINLKSYDEEITEQDIRRLIDDMYKTAIDPGEEIIHVIPQSYIVDNETGIKNPIGVVGKRLEGNYHIVIGNVSSAKNIEKCVDRVGLKVKRLVLEPIASSHAVLTEDEKEAGVALIDIGGGTTDIAVYYEGIIYHTAVIPFGGNVITKDIKEICAILQKDAERLKVEHGSALADSINNDALITVPGISGREAKDISYKYLSGIIQARMDEILDYALFQIENSGVMEKLSAGIVITGGGALLKDLPQLIRYKSGMDVRIGYPCEHLAASVGNDINHPMYSTAIGLLLNGLENPFHVEEDNSESVIESKTAISQPILQEEKKPIDEIKIESTEVREKKKSGLFSAIKDGFSNIFEENDSKL